MLPLPQSKPSSKGISGLEFFTDLTQKKGIFLKLRKFSSIIVDRIFSSLSEIFLPAFQGIKSVIYANKKPCSGIFQELWTDRVGLNPPGFWRNIFFHLAVDKPESKQNFIEQTTLLGSFLCRGNCKVSSFDCPNKWSLDTENVITQGLGHTEEGEHFLLHTAWALNVTGISD